MTFHSQSQQRSPLDFMQILMSSVTSLGLQLRSHQSLQEKIRIAVLQEKQTLQTLLAQPRLRYLTRTLPSKRHLSTVTIKQKHSSTHLYSQIRKSRVWLLQILLRRLLSSSKINLDRPRSKINFTRDRCSHTTKSGEAYSSNLSCLKNNQ